MRWIYWIRYWIAKNWFKESLFVSIDYGNGKDKSWITKGYWYNDKVYIMESHEYHQPTQGAKDE